jgi:hypothetical protein
MRIDTSGHAVETLPAEDRPAPRRSLSLTTAELLRLGLYRVGYVTVARSPSRDVNIVVHGADGMAVATADSVELAVDLADELGLILVPVH